MVIFSGRDGDFPLESLGRHTCCLFDRRTSRTDGHFCLLMTKRFKLSSYISLYPYSNSRWLKTALWTTTKKPIKVYTNKNSICHQSFCHQLALRSPLQMSCEIHSIRSINIISTKPIWKRNEMETWNSYGGSSLNQYKSRQFLKTNEAYFWN